MNLPKPMISNLVYLNLTHRSLYQLNSVRYVRTRSRSYDMKVVLVTGASTGIGREICLDLARTGCKIVAAARRLDKLNILCSEINAMENGVGDIRAFAVEIDLSANGNMIEASVGRAWDAFGRIDVLVNNAGIRGNQRFN